MYLQHHGILGQKWGVRRYQNPDGTLTPAGKKRYSGERLGVRLTAAANDRRVATQIKRIGKSESNIMQGREKNRAKIERKYDKKISKMPNEDLKNVVNEQKKAKLDDFDLGTKYVSESYSKGKELVERYYNSRTDIKISGDRKSPIKNTPEYKYAQAYVKTLNTSGVPIAQLFLASDIATGKVDQWPEKNRRK